MDSYVSYKNKRLVYNTAGLIVIALQTMLPPIKTKKQFPGCVRSFDGYPLDNTDNMSAIKYVCCVLLTLRTDDEPYNILSKSRTSSSIDKLTKIVYQGISAGLYNIPEVIQRIETRNSYIKEDDEMEIPTYLNISNWSTFLPPINININIKNNIPTVSEQMKKKLTYNIQNCNREQYEQLNVLSGKIILSSFKIQEIVQNIINKAVPLLSSGGEPFIENFCCNDNNYNIFDFFNNINKNYVILNTNVQYYTNFIYTVNLCNKPVTMIDPYNTRTPYDILPAAFSEEVIYKAFLVFCKVGKDIPISNDLMAICSIKDDGIGINIDDSIKNKIHKLKENGFNYDTNQLDMLMYIINRRNIVHINLESNYINYNDLYFNRYILSLTDHNSSYLSNDIRNILQNMVARENINNKITEMPGEMKTAINTLAERNSVLETLIYSFMSERMDIDSKKESTIKMFFDSLTTWNIDENTSDENFKNINFSIRFMKDIIYLYPNIILNNNFPYLQQTKDKDSILIPEHWKLSKIHSIVVKNFVSKYYEKLIKYYDNPEGTELNPILLKIQDNCKVFYNIAKNIPINTTIHDSVDMFNVFNERVTNYLLKNLILSVFQQYIDESGDMTPIIAIGGDEPEDEVEFTIRTREKEVVARLMLTYMEMYNNEKNKVNLSYSNITDITDKVTNIEKMKIVAEKDKMTQEERNLDTEMQRNKMGRWGIGLLKSVKQYDKAAFDREVAELTEDFKRANNVDMDIFSHIIEDDNRGRGDNIQPIPTVLGEEENNYDELEAMRMSNVRGDDDNGEDAEEPDDF